MKQSLSINKYVLKLLKANSALMALTPYERIYPIYAKQGTTFPFIVINRDSVLSAYSKDGCFEDTVTVTATAVTDRYDVSVSIASEIRNSLEGKRYKDDNIYISQITMQSANETIYNNAFIQQLTFVLKVQ